MTTFANLVALVGLLAVQRIPIFEGEDGDRRDTKFVGGTKRPYRNLAPVRDQQFSNHATLMKRGNFRPGGYEATQH